MPNRLHAFATSVAAVRAMFLYAAVVLLSGCASLDAVRDFSKSAAVMSGYPLAASAYVDSAATSAPYVADASQSLVTRGQRQKQVDSALALQAVVSRYFATLARLAGADDFNLATLKSMYADVGSIRDGGFDRATIDAYAGLSKTLGDFALVPARERAVKDLVVEGGPNAMRIVDALRSVSADWRAQVANDAKQVDDTLGVAVLPADVPPLLRILANDRKGELSVSYATTLRKMRTAENALAAVEMAHAEMAAHLDDLQGDFVRTHLRDTAEELRSATVALSSLR